ncbi:MAG TPA: hypothetical protein VF622_03770 [Segetibacter sp.]|jgi:hypothetical protein
MIKTKQQLLSFLTVVIFSIIAVGSNPSKKTFGNSENWIPQNFDPKTTTLLIENFSASKSAEEKMQQYMSESYPYKYEFVDLKTIQNRTGKYADTRLYKFALVISMHSSTINKSQGASSSIGLTTTGFDFHFFDRDLIKNYPSTKRASSYPIMTFKPVINTIVKHFQDLK